MPDAASEPPDATLRPPPHLRAVGFIFLIVAFHLVSRRNWCVGRHDRLPQYAAHHGAPTAPARARRRLCPLRRLKAREGAEAGVTRIPPPSAPPSYAHALSTPAVRTAVICEPRPLAWQRLLRFGTSPSAARGVWSGVPVPVTATPMPTPTPGFPPPPYTALPPRTAVAAFHRDRR